MLDAQLVSASVASRDAYERIAPFITAKDMTPAGGFWFGIIGEWYANDRNARSVEKSVLADGGSKRITNPKHKDTLMGFINELPEPVSPANVAQTALELKRHNTGLELASAIAAQDGKKAAALHKLYGELLSATELKRRKGKWQLAASAEDLFARVGQGNRIELAPSRLNDRIGGGALPGHSVVVFGRPDSGKSTVAINLAAVTANRGQRVLYVGNEDQIDILKSRAMSRMTNMTMAEMEANQERALRLWRDRGGEDRLRFAQLINGSVADIPEQIEDFEPTILIIDQLRGLQGEGDGMTQRLESNGIAVRNLLLQYGLVGISVTQANDRRQGYTQKPPIWLDMGDVDSSRTGLPGTADLLLGIGFDDDMKARNQRAISFAKNKLSSAPDAKEGLIVEINSSLSKVQ